MSLHFGPATGDDAAPFYGRCGYAERGRVVYRGTPLVHYELLLTRGAAEYG
ncbi:MAG TPA: hypothetical protein VFX50_10295 [Gemmatimonadales bacterium]|nr:hypothetical protein [Gemmatimonadales bacterium]